MTKFIFAGSYTTNAENFNAARPPAKEFTKGPK